MFDSWPYGCEFDPGSRQHLSLTLAKLYGLQLSSSGGLFDHLLLGQEGGYWVSC